MTSASRFQTNIQGLRGIAVLAVVLYHAGASQLAGGYVGVDMFFVISGYLITGLLWREREETGTIDFGRFYARRARRLLPAAFVVLVSTLAMATLIFAPIEQQQTAASGLASAVYLSNYWFANRATDYLAGGAETDPFLHTWSLAVEEQFYLAWPLIVFVGLLGANRSRSRTRAALLILAIAVASYLACRQLTWKNQPWAFFSVHTRAWEFAVGALACWVVVGQVSRCPRVLIQGAAWVGAGCIAVAVLSFDRRTSFPGSAAMLPVVGTFLLIAAGASDHRTLPRRVIESQPLVWLGDLSYSWYLWHWPVLVFAESLASGSHGWAASAGVMISLLLAVLSFRLVEQPIRVSLYLALRSRISLVGAVLLSVSSAAVALSVQWNASSEMSTQAQLRFTVARADRPRVYQTACHAKYDVVDVPECAFGDPTSSRSVVLFGDSHAAHWFPAMERLALAQGWRLLSLTKSACPAPVVTVYNQVKKRPYTECNEWRDRVIQRVVAERPALVVISSASSYWDPALGQRDGVVDPSSWRAGVNELLARLGAAGIPVLLIRDVPLPGFNVPLCLSRAQMGLASMVSDCSFAQPTAGPGVEDLARWEREAVERSPTGLHVDLTTEICGGGRCRVERDGLIYFSDSEHLTASFSAELARPIAEAIRQGGRSKSIARLDELLD